MARYLKELLKDNQQFNRKMSQQQHLLVIYSQVHSQQQKTSPQYLKENIDTNRSEIVLWKLLCGYIYGNRVLLFSHKSSKP